MQSNNLENYQQDNEQHKKVFPISKIGLQKTERDLYEEFKALRKVKKGKCCDLVSIKADFIKIPNGKQLLIASEAPNKTNQGEFWRIVLEEKIDKIIMICQEGENYCPIYWPRINSELQFEGIKVQNISDGFLFKGDQSVQKRILKVFNDKEEIQVTHVFVQKSFLQFIKWPGWVDLGVPKQNSYYIIIQLVKSALASLEEGQKCLIHCLKGIGRTGTLMCIINCVISIKQQIQSQKQLQSQDHDQLNLSIFQTLYDLRQQRTGMVELDGQYQYIYDFLSKIYQDKEIIV